MTTKIEVEVTAVAGEMTSTKRVAVETDIDSETAISNMVAGSWACVMMGDDDEEDRDGDN